MDVSARTEPSRAALHTCRWRRNSHRSGSPWADCSCGAPSPATAAASAVAAASWLGRWRRLPLDSPGTSIRDGFHACSSPVHQRGSVDIVFILKALQHSACPTVRYGAACRGVFQAREDPIDAIGQRSKASDAPEVAYWQTFSFCLLHPAGVQGPASASSLGSGLEHRVVVIVCQRTTARVGGCEPRASTGAAAVRGPVLRVRLLATAALEIL